ncbi:RNA-binding protein NOB1 isoform X2 [Pseudoliparis swirei]|uniref:RNA-binding protein NOB1 isoform X2 n=1 Tax=Pseudoliparis swirei TaxID=2059687 RepID=UPI0024BEEEC6|nr:RNA-binding protein NOB1 isoform X2 [Pseudoliparis swirei]
MAATLVAHVVADAGAFLKKAPLQDIGSNIYTLRDVVNEIRDKPTRKSLAFLPYQLTFKEPHPEHVRLVTEFSKKTGDYLSLSATDIKVLALTYQLELEHVGGQHLKKEPQLKVDVHSTPRHPETPVNVAGFHFPSQKHVGSLSVHQRATSSCEKFNSFQFWREPLPSIDSQLLELLDPVPEVHQNQTDSQFNSFQFWRAPLASIDRLLELLDTPLQTEDQSDEDKENEPEEEEEEGGGGWITPSNIRQLKMDSADWTAPADVTVGCLTTDFAMQNVLIQIGLHVLSVNGMLIRQARNYILRCHACFRTTSIMTKAFCPHCGNATLKKLAVTLGEDGSTQVHFSRNPKVLNPRGLRHPLPLPQGGKHSSNPLLVEDQRAPQQRQSRKARQQTDVLDPDSAVGGSPFCQNDVDSRAANLQIRDGRGGGGRRRSNPNATHKKSAKNK